MSDAPPLVVFSFRLSIALTLAGCAISREMEIRPQHAPAALQDGASGRAQADPVPTAVPLGIDSFPAEIPARVRQLNRRGLAHHRAARYSDAIAAFREAVAEVYVQVRGESGGSVVRYAMRAGAAPEPAFENMQLLTKSVVTMRE